MSVTDVRNNPFIQGGEVAKSGQRSIQETQQSAKEMGEIQARVYLAKQFSRSPAEAYDKIMTSCQRIGLASVAIYSYARGGTSINGPSIRLAEEIARDWGNIDCGWLELQRNERESTVRAYAWDLETNAYKQIVFVVPLQRTKKNKSGAGYITTPLTDERDIYELLANNAARRMRNCILALIPGDIVEAAVDQCHRTLVTQCEITPDRIKKMLTAYSAFGVTKAQIEGRIQRKLEAIQPAQFVKLMEIYNSLKDGMSEPADWFESETIEAAPQTATDTLKNLLKQKSSLPPKQESTPAPFDTAGDQAKEETAGNTDEEPLYDRLEKKIKRTRTKAGLKAIYDSVMMAAESEQIDTQQANELFNLIDAQSVSQ